MHRRSLAALFLAGSAQAQTQTQTQAQTQGVATHPMPPAGRRAWAAQIPVLRFGILGGENEADRIGRYDGYRRLLEENFGIPVRLLFAADYAGVQQAFAAKQLEASYMSPAAYAATWMDTNGGVEPLLVTREADGSTSYVSVMYVRADSGIAALEQMRGKAMGWADPNSASGYLIPRSEMRAAGINPDQFFSRTGFAGGHEQLMVAVLGRQFDAGVAWASGQGEMSEGFSRGALRAAVDKGLLRMADIRIIWRSRPIQNGPLVVRSDLPDSFKQDMVAFHLALPGYAPEIHRAIERGSAIGWAPTRHEDYAVFVDMRRVEAQERRRRN